LLRRQLLDLRDDAADDDHLAVAAALDLGERAVGLAPQLVADRVQRMLGHVEAEGLLLEPQQLVLLVLPGWNRRMVAIDVRLGFAEAEIEDRPLSEARVFLMALAPREQLLEALEHPHARSAETV